jgi:hypothetical protein
MKPRIAVTSALVLALAACSTDKTRATADSAAAAEVASNATDEARREVIPKGETAALAPAPAPAPAPPAEPAAGRWQVTPAGIGEVKAGMSVEEANVALGNILAIPARLQECDFVRPKSSPKHLAFMVEQGRITRVDVQEGSDIATVEGAKIGDTEARIKSLYPGVAITPAKYTSGHYLIVTPKSGGNNRIVFETDGMKVTKYRSGSLPAVQYVEGCS